MVDRNTAQLTQVRLVGYATLSVPEALAMVSAGRGVLVDARDARLYENVHAAGALSLPVSTIEDTGGGAAIAALPKDRNLIFYCA